MYICKLNGCRFHVVSWYDGVDPERRIFDLRKFHFIRLKNIDQPFLAEEVSQLKKKKWDFVLMIKKLLNRN